jgi:hypothetical protein
MQYGVEVTPFPERVKFRLYVDPDKSDAFALITEPYGREILISRGRWVDVECVNGDGTPAEIWINPDGRVGPCSDRHRRTRRRATVLSRPRRDGHRRGGGADVRA